MKRTSFDAMNCSLARTLEVVGEWWTLLILREALWGTTRFDDFQRRLGIARNILTVRLKKLETHGLILRAPEGGYALTDKGRALFPAIVALMQWGDDWLHADIGPPITFHDRASGGPIQRIGIRTAGGQDLLPDQVSIHAGPGATARTRARAGD
ncbi:MAG: winged helix-turn-helix transcriptional regulator [Paracoccaceae bacterium]